MQNDEIIWRIINKHFCSFKYSTNKVDFCKNDKNVTGLCNRTSCPLANSNYGTVLEYQGTCYLYLKTVERAHTPKTMWEKIKLSKNYSRALDQIDEHMKNVYSQLQMHRCKLRLTRLRQTLIRMRRLELKPQLKYVAVKKKTERREDAREKKAEKAAKLDTTIEEELLNRLQRGTYGSLYKVEESQNMDLTEIEDFSLEKEELDENDFANLEFVDVEDIEQESESDEDYEFSECEDDMEVSFKTVRECNGSSDIDNLDKISDFSNNQDSVLRRASMKHLMNTNRGAHVDIKRRKAPRVEIEYEHESTTRLESA
ncbi:Mak16 protein [Cardiosporidium cionae]|uniref:Protein MAK16 homolog n=1 Tax=Cardiosporidium cionae TaxID=476202 RepID=A0ABQ7J6S5_9APIC|nr:Mak16 protein [Cardiosporidium cionae]|eukprot:KAF8819663.1 Mak16 protein [Cardiosporidium cionae]